MSMDAISAIVEQTDVSTPLGLRDRTMLILLYDTAARVDELVGIKLRDFQFGKFPKVRLHGKRGKDRDVPMLERTVQYLKKYLLEPIPAFRSRPTRRCSTR
jgi:site-specific recombinase XerD